MIARWVTFLPVILVLAPAFGVIIDRIAVRVNNSIIKDSDISRNIRVTDFLNDWPLSINSEARKEAAKRLVDQVFIREEIRVGDYPRAEWSEADQELAKVQSSRYKSATAFHQACLKYGLTEGDLRFEFHWQLTVLRFIDARFRPAVLVTDSDVEQYYRGHQARYKNIDSDDARDQIRETITGEKVNEQFFAWLESKRNVAKAQYFEAGLE